MASIDFRPRPVTDATSNPLRIASLQGMLPNYVAVGDARCDLCVKQRLRFGYHAEPNIDLCMDCHDQVMRMDTAQDVIEFRRKFKVDSRTQWVQFEPQRN